MRCQCIICQELFENSNEEVISALDCGHTFHNVCLNQWLENGSTCPSCRKAVNRKNIIHRLYFDAPEDVDTEVDSVKLENELDRLKLEVQRKEKEKNDAVREKDKALDKLEKTEKSKAQIEREISGHLKTLRYYDSQQKALETERQECRKIKQKLVMLQSCETLLNGCEADAAAIISNTGEGPGAVQSLSRQVAFLKREYEKLKLEKKQIRDHYEKIQLKDAQKDKAVNELKKECEKLQEQLERSEGDLKIAEREVDFLRKTNTRLKRVLKSPRSTDTASSSFTKIMNDSDQMNVFTSSTPKLGRPVNTEEIDLDVTPDLFASPVKENISEKLNSQSDLHGDNNLSQLVKKSQKRPLESSKNCENEDTKSVKLLKTSSLAEKHSQTMKKFKSESSVTDFNSISAIAGMNIFKKRALGEGPSITRKGYDGFGGHTTFVNSLGVGKNIFKKPSVKRTSTKQVKPSSTSTYSLINHGFSVLD